MRPVSPSTCGLSAVSSGVGREGGPQDVAPEGRPGSSLGPQSRGPAAGLPSPCHVVLGSLPPYQAPADLGYPESWSRQWGHGLSLWSRSPRASREGTAAPCLCQGTSLRKTLSRVCTGHLMSRGSE